jgi:histone H3/H4
MPASSVTRPSTVEQFLKTTTGLRVGPKPIEVFLAHLDALALAVAKKAAEIAQADGGRATLLERDITQAFEAAGGVPSGPPDPAAVFTQLDRLTTDQLAALINQIRDWLATRPPR